MVTCQWLLACLEQHKQVPFEPYLVKRDDTNVSAMGQPDAQSTQLNIAAVEPNKKPNCTNVPTLPTLSESLVYVGAVEPTSKQTPNRTEQRDVFSTPVLENRRISDIRRQYNLKTPTMPLTQEEGDGEDFLKSILV